MSLDHSKIRDITFSYEKIVIGSSLEALLYCYYNSVPFVYANLDCPNRFSYFEWNVDLSEFGLGNKSRIISTSGVSKKIGTSKDHLWEKLYFDLSLAGLNPLADKVASIRVEGKTLKAFTHKARMAKISFGKVVVFNPDNVAGLPPPVKIPKKKYKVYDWMNVRLGTQHKYDWIEDMSHFVNCILFYPSDRIDGKKKDRKDLVAISYLSESELEDYEYSDVNARFKVIHLMKEAGIRGPRNGRDPNNKKIQKYRGIKIETSHREIELLEMPVYESTDTIEFNNDSYDDIMSKNKLCESYVARTIQ